MRRCWILWLAMGACVPLACTRSEPGAPAKAVRNVLIISMDTTRTDHLGCYGYHRAASPELDALASRPSVVLFRNAYSTSPWTLPAHASLLTGLHPQVHGAVLAGDLTADGTGPLIGRLPEGTATLATVLAEHGFRTAAFVSGPLMNRAFGLDQGFELYDDRLPLTRDDDADDPTPKRPAAETVEAAGRWWRQHLGESKFTLVHLFDPHKPYDCPEAFADTVEEDRLNSYDLEIRYMTHHIGRLLDDVAGSGEEAATLVVITSDHGESFGEIHAGLREVGHGKTLYEEVVRNVLLMRLPSWWEGKPPAVITEPVQIVDLFPSILEMLAISTPPSVGPGPGMGRSLVPLLRGRSPETTREILLHLGLNRCAPVRGTRYEARLDGLISGPWKYVRSSRSGEDRLFDLAVDPHETTNLVEEKPEAVERLKGRLEEILALLRPSGEGPVPPRLDDELRKGLERLGYLR